MVGTGFNYENKVSQGLTKRIPWTIASKSNFVEVFLKAKYNLPWLKVLKKHIFL